MKTSLTAIRNSTGQPVNSAFDQLDTYFNRDRQSAIKYLGLEAVNVDLNHTPVLITSSERMTLNILLLVCRESNFESLSIDFPFHPVVVELQRWHNPQQGEPAQVSLPSNPLPNRPSVACYAPRSDNILPYEHENLHIGATSEDAHMHKNTTLRNLVLSAAHQTRQGVPQTVVGISQPNGISGASELACYSVELREGQPTLVFRPLEVVPDKYDPIESQPRTPIPVEVAVPQESTRITPPPAQPVTCYLSPTASPEPEA